MMFFSDESDFCSTIRIMQKNMRQYEENIMKPEGKANTNQSLKKKSFEITRYACKISFQNLNVYLLSVIYFLYLTQVNRLITYKIELHEFLFNHQKNATSTMYVINTNNSQIIS